MNHDWWAVELRVIARSIDTLGIAAGDARDAIDRVLELIEEGPDCSECFERWMDEAGGAPDVEDFPEVLGEEQVIRILALEDAVLVRHALDQWLVALGARRARRIEQAELDRQARERAAVEVPF